MLLVIDNYDSFTYNLVQYFGELGANPQVKRNDAITPDEVEKMKPQKRYLLMFWKNLVSKWEKLSKGMLFRACWSIQSQII